MQSVIFSRKQVDSSWTAFFTGLGYLHLSEDMIL